MFNSINIAKLFQGKNKSPNRIILRKALGLGFSIVRIRKALIELNGLSQTQIAGEQISKSTLSNTIKNRGSKGDSIAKDLVAKNLDLTVNELFPE